MTLRERYTKSLTAGAVSWNTYSDLRGRLGSICVNPSVSTTVYDYSLTDDDGNVIYNKKGLRGTWVDDSKLDVFGIYTHNIINSSTSNYSFTTTLIWNEKV